jgi:hypothetical protein
MANIIVKNLVINNLCEELTPASFVRDLSECELGLQGGLSLKKSLGNIPTLEPGNFCLTLVNGQLVEIFC